MLTIITLQRALRPCFYLPLLCALFFCPVSTNAQGRIVINEFLPWPSNGCGTTAEFIELFNFGPGPINIGGYIVTDGDYAITIPANTMVAAGSFYVLAGQNTIPQNCGNDLRSVIANLNWNTCGCSSAPIPTSGDGFMTDGGGANEQVLLLDPQLQVIDAVVRSLPAEPSSLITTSTVGGQFPAQSFDLDNMSFTYETIGESLGRGNSMARRVDGGCGWIKDTQESAGDINNTSGLVSELVADMNITKPATCSSTGSVAVTVANALLFPMSYTLAKDVDTNYVFDFTDTYTIGTDNTAPVIEVKNLDSGRYRLVVESALGCDLKAFNFTILGCGGLLLDQVFTETWASRKGSDVLINWNIPDRQMIQLLDIEKSDDGTHFTRYTSLTDINSSLYKAYFYTSAGPVNMVSYYRIRLTTKDGRLAWSKVLKLTAAGQDDIPFITAQSPFTSQCNLRINAAQKGYLQLAMYDLTGRPVLTKKIDVQEGSNAIHLLSGQLPAGPYILRLSSENGLPLKTLCVIKSR